MKTEKLNPVNFIAFFTVVIGFFMVLLDSTIVNVTLPAMTRYFSTDMSTISWVVNAYNLAFAVLMLTGSRLADQFGRKKIFIIGIFFFTLTSFLSGISTSVNMLIFFRVLQGMAGALVLPVSMPLIIELFPQSKQGLIIGIWGAIAGVATACGPALGGIISEYFNWQWIFYINIPIGAVALIIMPFVVKESYDPTAGRKIDWPGVLTLSVAMFCVILGLIQANDKGWGSVYIISLFAISLVCFIAFVFLERKESEPMLPMALFRNPYFCMTNISLIILGAGTMCGAFFTAFYLTQVMEFSQVKAGLVITAYPAGLILTSAISGGLSEKLGNRIFAFPGAILNCIAIYYMSGLNVDSSMNDILMRLAFCGAAMGFAFPSITTAAVKASPAEKIGMASAVGNVGRTFGATLGVALLVTAVTHFGEIELDKGRAEAKKSIMSSTVFNQELKDTLCAKMDVVKFSKNNKIPGKEELISIFETRKEDAVKKAPPMMKPMVKKVYEKQITEISSMYDSIKRTFLVHISSAFSHTFRLSGIGLLIGIVFAFVCEPLRRRKK